VYQIRKVAEGEIILFDYLPTLKQAAELVIPNYEENVYFAEEKSLIDHLIVHFYGKLNPLKDRLEEPIARTKNGGLDIIWRRKALVALRRRYEIAKVQVADEGQDSLKLSHFFLTFALTLVSFPLCVLCFCVEVLWT